jgi:hypothetical protein
MPLIDREFQTSHAARDELDALARHSAASNGFGAAEVAMQDPTKAEARNEHGDFPTRDERLRCSHVQLVRAIF